MTFFTKKLRQGGDTIVEVLIVLAIVGMALSISYATANRGIQGVRQSQEHSEALQLAQTQLEELRAYSSNGGSFNVVSQKCMNNGSPSTSCLFALDTLSSIPSGVGYTVAITSSTAAPASAADPIYTITVTWPDVKGTGTDLVDLSYRLPA